MDPFADESAFDAFAGGVAAGSSGQKRPRDDITDGLLTLDSAKKEKLQQEHHPGKPTLITSTPK